MTLLVKTRHHAISKYKSQEYNSTMDLKGGEVVENGVIWLIAIMTIIKSPNSIQRSAPIAYVWTSSVNNLVVN